MLLHGFMVRALPGSTNGALCLSTKTEPNVPFTARNVWHLVQVIKPKFLEFAGLFPRAIYLKVDVDLCAETAGKMGVSSMPTFKVLEGGEEVASVRGANEAALKSMLSKHCSA